MALYLLVSALDLAVLKRRTPSWPPYIRAFVYTTMVLCVILALLEVWTAKTDEYYIKSLIRMNYNIDRELCDKVW